MNCYIFRIYREEPDKPNALVGIVEEVEKKDKRTFSGGRALGDPEPGRERTAGKGKSIRNRSGMLRQCDVSIPCALTADSTKPAEVMGRGYASSASLCVPDKAHLPQVQVYEPSMLRQIFILE